MDDRAISLSAWEVRAILEGRKSQLRFPLDPVFGPLCGKWVPELEAGVSYPEQGWWTWEMAPQTYTGRVEVGMWPGLRLWVKEDFATTGPMGITRYYATDDVHGLRRRRHAIEMPRSESRLTLTVTSIRLQELQRIGEADAIAEGIEMVSLEGRMGQPLWRNYGCPEVPDRSARYSFLTLWNSVHGIGAWNRNPLVAAVTFLAERRNVDG